MNVPLQIIYKTSSVGRWTVEIHSDSHKSSAHEIKLSGYSIPGSHRLYRDRGFWSSLLQRTKTKQPETRHWKGTCIWSENWKVLFSKRKDGYLVAIGCCKNGCPPSGVEAIPVDGIWSDIIPVMVSKMILPLYTRENDPKFTNYFCQHGFETTTFSNPTIPDGC